MRKKLFAILMSAMMMVTFMPAMAFAGATTPELTWGENFATATVNYAGEDYTINTDRLAGGSPTNWNGQIVAMPRVSELAKDSTVPQVVIDEFTGKKATYYDVNGAVLQYTKSGVPTDLPDIYAKGDFSGIFTNATTPGTYAVTGLKLTLPTYVNGYFDETHGYAPVVVTYATLPSALPKTSVRMKTGSPTFKNWGFEFKTPAGYDAKSYAEQNFDVNVEFDADTVANGSADYPYLLGSVSKKITVKKSTPAKEDIVFFVDQVTSVADDVIADSSDKGTNTDIGGTYDGAEHKVVTPALEGVTVDYLKWNSKTAKYEAVDAITWKDATTSSVKYKAVVKDSKSTVAKDEYDFEVSVAKAEITASLGDEYVYEGTAINAADFIKLSATTSGDLSSDKAAKADKDAIKAALAIKYDVVATKTTTPALAVNPGFVVVDTYALNSVPKTETPEITAAYAKACKNWTLTPPAKAGTVSVVEGKVNELDFLGNASMTKTVHVKNAKAVKKAAVKHIKAEALSGTAITFKKLSGNSKITVAADGTMTVKKGLKKGTYKVNVKAVAAAGNGFKRISTKATYTVKVVK